MDKDFTIEELLENKELPSHDFLFSLVNNVSEVLEAENPEYRPKDESGNPGALLELKDDIPVIIVPDLHARPSFLLNLLKFKPGNKILKNKDMSVKEALEKKLIYIVCVGDAIHTEHTGERWKKIEDEFYENNFTGPEMKAEMTECFSTLTAIMKLKCDYPENFHFIKGNHENILNETANGDYAFCKYAEEGQMVKMFISEYYGDDILFLISFYEQSLPLIVSAKNCVISHAEPSKPFTRKELINAREDPETVFGLIWTRNGQVKDNTVQPVLENLLGKKSASDAFYFAGHRPVNGKYSLRQNGKFVQIHNPLEQNVAIVSKNKIFDPEKDIYEVNS
ncbi:MAG: metallophosphoesterase [Treponema sp.]|nr:metallophosphoesterase [Treponema sp.]